MILAQLFLAFSLSVAQPTLKQKKIRFKNGTELLVEVAATDQERATGLMYRTELKEGRGMLFIFEPPQILSFWMKNTFIPLSIGFFSSKKILLETQDMSPSQGPVKDEALTHYRSSQSAMYAIEVPMGWFKKNKIKIGEQFSFIK